MTHDTKATHTPGPWRAVDLRHQKNGQVRIFGHIQHVANALAHNTECEANARLIAAAPDLLEALQRIANEPCDHGPQDFCPREIAQTAIRKATERE